MTKFAHVVFVVLLVTSIITAANRRHYAPSVLAESQSVVKQIKLIGSGVTVLEIVEMKKDGDLTHSWTNVIASLDGRSCAFFKRSSQ